MQIDALATPLSPQHPWLGNKLCLFLSLVRILAFLHLCSFVFGAGIGSLCQVPPLCSALSLFRRFALDFLSLAGLLQSGFSPPCLVFSVFSILYLIITMCHYGALGLFPFFE